MARKIRRQTSSSAKSRGKSNRKLRCFLSAAAGTNINTIVRVLKSQNVELIDAMPPAGTELLSSVTRLISKADFILGIIADDRGAASTLFELGMAIGLGKPVIAVVAPSAAVPNALRGFFSVSADPSDEEALNFNLPIFLKSIHYSTPESVIRTETNERAFFPTRTVTSTHTTTMLQEHARLESEVADALRNFAGATIVEAAAGEARPDIVAWIPGLRSDFGNPVIIEVKSSHRLANSNQLKSQLSRFFTMPGLKTVIVTHPDDDRSRLEFTGDGYVFFLGLNELKRSLARKDLNSLLVGLRNKAAHGDY